MEINPTNKIDRYYKYIGPFIIFLGIIRLITFYNYFGIAIIDYLNFSEIITSFLDIIVFIVLYFVYIYIQNYLTSNKSELDIIINKRQKIIEEKKLWKVILLYLNYLKKILILELIIIISFGILHFFFKEIANLVVAVVSIFLITSTIFLIISVEIERKHYHLNSTEIRKQFISIALISLYLILFIMGYSFYQAYSVKNMKSTCGVTIMFDNNEIFVSDSTNYYIGKTQNYIFIHHQEKNTTDVFPMTRIKQMIFPHKERNEFMINWK